MTQALANAGQFIVRSASAAAPQATQAATQIATSSLTNATMNVLFGPVKRKGEGPRREEVHISTAAEGVGIPRLFGRQRLGGQIIWITPFKETTEVETTGSGSKGVRRSTSQETTTYRYSVSLALALCQGPITRIGRIWGDGRPLSADNYNVRVYLGTDDQLPDPLIEVEEGPENAPAYRGIAYIVFEDLDLEEFGNRVPQFNVEVERSLAPNDPDALETAARAVTMIPASGETVYHTDPVSYESDEGVSVTENVHSYLAGTDAVASYDHLQASLPNLSAVSLIVSWFGDDLRVGHCRVEPRVEDREKRQQPEDWVVAGKERKDVEEVSKLPDGSPSYGGTPSDLGVRQSLRDLRDRGLGITFYPFILMDIPAGNTLPHLDGSLGQPSFPWRGRITAGSDVEGTSSARDEVNAFFSSYRKMVLHYAQLCAEEVTLDAFLIGSEMRGLTRIRDENGDYPAVEAFRQLAADVRAIVGPDVKISYAADWSEYSNHRSDDGSGDILFPLDALWADQNIDFIGIDNYMPLADWRVGLQHLDYLAGTTSIHDKSYLAQNIRGGEGYDWYYASSAARDNQDRTPITDTAHGEDWIFRYKDLWSWWSSEHYERPSGIREATPTAWQPQSKPIWFTELGCSATDKGANQPNVFFDPKSSESALPYYSNGNRDDVMQRHFIEAHLEFWQDVEDNPISSIYGKQMVDTDHIFLYTWDARPFPSFPALEDVWSDAENWAYGHWLNGRVGKVPAGDILVELAHEAGVTSVSAGAATALVTGYALTSPMTARSAMEPLIDLYQLDAKQTAGTLVITPRDGLAVTHRGQMDLVDHGGKEKAGEVVTFTRAQEADLPGGLSLSYTDGLSDYVGAVADAVDPGAISPRKLFVNTAVVMEAGEAEGRAVTLLEESRSMRTSASFGLPGGDIAVEPGDVLTVGDEQGADHRMRVTGITSGPWRDVTAVSIHDGLYEPRYTGLSGSIDHGPTTYGPPVCVPMDLPLLPEGQDGAFMRVAAFADPWPGQVAIYADTGTSPPYLGAVPAPSIVGRLTHDLSPGPLYRWDEGAALSVKLSAGGLSSRTDASVLDGGGRCVVATRDGGWEVIGYRTAALNPDGTWTLTGLLRALRGTEAEMMSGAERDARIVFLDDGQLEYPLSADRFGTSATWQAGPAQMAPGAYPYRDVDVAFVGRGARPFSPVHLNVVDDGTTLSVNWIRRTRIGGDNWSVGEVPLGETIERYRIQTYDAAGDVLEDVDVSQTSVTVAAVGVQRLSVAQYSDLFGDGAAVWWTR